MFGNDSTVAGVPIFKSVLASMLILISTWILPATTEVRADDAELLFTDFNPNSRITVDYGPWSDVLDFSVWDTGRSDRTYARPQVQRLLSRIAAGNPNPTRLEANRVFYHLFGREQVDFVTGYKATLEEIPLQASLSRFSRDEQLAYWLNLYTVTVYEYIARNYPVTVLDNMRAAGGFFETKVLVVEGVSLSLREVELRILASWDNPLVIYGLYQGAIGGPNIRTSAFTGAQVYQQLGSNAREFINSLRGLRFSDEQVQVSQIYEWNSHFFPDFETDLRNHLMQYADADVASLLLSSKGLVAEDYDWHIADLYNGQFSAGASSNNPVEVIMGQNIGQQTGAVESPQANTFTRVLPPTGYPEHVRIFIQEIRIRNATNQRGINIVVDGETPDNNGNN